tara:strand:+ start:989 stop:1201 length:213 start_codon:yes stop_codon:yes gene_type:complete
MLNTYKFKFKYEANGQRAKGTGEVKAESIPEAKIVAENGVAQDFGGSTTDVAIVSIRQVNAKKKRHANHS